MTLPVELYRPILEELSSPHDLCSFMRVSRAFQHEAERLLYRDVTILTCSELHDNFMRHLLKHLHLPLCVYSLSIKQRPKEDGDSSTPVTDWDTNVHGQLVRDVLRTTFNLKVLYIDHTTTISGTPLFYSCSFRLHTVSIGSLSPLDYSAFEAQSDIFELAFSRDYLAQHVFEKGAFPKLRILRCDGANTEGFLKNRRHVDRMQLTKGIPTGGPYEGVKSMDVFLFTTRLDQLRQIVRHFPSLRYLKVSVLSLSCDLNKTPAVITDAVVHTSFLVRIYLLCRHAQDGKSPILHSRHFDPLFSKVPSLESIVWDPVRGPGLEWSRGSAEIRHLPSGTPDEWRDDIWMKK